MTMMSFKSSLSKTSRKITWSVVCSPPSLSHFRQSTLFLKNSWSHCDHKVFTAQLWGETSSHNGFSLSAHFQRKIILRSESTSCCSLEKVEVQVGSILAVVQGSPTGASQLIVLNRAMHHSLNTHTLGRDIGSCEFQALHHLQRTSRSLRESASDLETNMVYFRSFANSLRGAGSERSPTYLTTIFEHLVLSNRSKRIKDLITIRQSSPRFSF